MISLFVGATKGYCGKKTSGYTNNFGDAILASTVRMILCTAIGFIVILASEDRSTLRPSMEMIFISALSGISTAIFVVSWLILAKKNAYMMLNIFLMLGVLIPLIASSIFFNEAIKVTQWIGIAMLFLAVAMMCSYNNSIKTKITLPSFILLLICGIANGVVDFSQKLFTKNIPDGSVAVFNFYTYIFAALVLIVFFAITRKKVNNVNNDNIKKIFLFILIMAICLFANSYFKTLASGHLSAVLLYPLYQGCDLAFSVVMSAVLFKEKITVKAVLGILTAFIGLMIINLI